MDIIPIVGILMPVLLVAVVLSYSYRKEHERNRLIEKMIEKGQDPASILPLLNGRKEEEKNPTKHFKSGITLTSIGLGLMVAGWLCDWSTIGIGAFLAIIGLGELALAWYLRKYSK
ncbi:MAG: hypothetical protein KBS70_00690 [Bacteroidales bacterium]|nr:hypothetical protein [Candidatus Colicola equi]